MQNKLTVKFAILSIAIFLMSHTAIAPAIPKLYQMYHTSNPNIGLASVESLVTIPAMMITIFIILSNFIINKLGKKKTTLLGLTLILVSGLISFFTTNFTLVLIARLILGTGIGLYNSISVSIISDYYEEKDRASMIGLRTAFLNIGKALTTFIAGYALVFGANYTFLVYLLVVPVFYMFYRYIEDKNVDYKPIKSLVVFDKNLLVLALITFLVGIAYIGATIKIPSLLVSKLNYTNAFSSNMVTILAFSGILIGFIFGKLIKIFANKTMLIMIATMGVGNFMFTLGNHKILFFVGAILIGASFVGIMSSVFTFISQNYKKESINFATSMAITAGNIGVILTPVVLTKLPEKLSAEIFVTPFYITSILMVLAISLFSLLKEK